MSQAWTGCREQVSRRQSREGRRSLFFATLCRVDGKFPSVLVPLPSATRHSQLPIPLAQILLSGCSLLINNHPRSLENRSRGEAPQTEAEPMVLGARSLYEVFLEVRRRSRRRQVLSDGGDCDRKTPTLVNKNIAKR